MSDAVSQLRDAIAPKRGMRRIALPTESYQHPSLPLSAKRLLNFYAEQEPKDARSEVALISAPGLTPFETYGAGPIHAMNADLPGRIYVASGTGFYRRRENQPIEYLGEIGNPDLVDRMVTIAVGPLSAVVVVPPNAYVCGHSEPMQQIAGDFPGARSVAYLDGYFVFTSVENSGRFFSSRLLDPLTVDALDFAFADGLTNVISRVITHRGELWLIGASGIEVWYDAGAADFAFRRQSGGVIPFGSAAIEAIAQGDNSVFWVGVDGNVYRSEGYQARRISTHAIEAIIRGYGPGQATSGFTYAYDGHTFYSVTFGTRTFVYDCATKLWHERSSSADGSGRWRANVSAVQFNQPLLGDATNGSVYTIDAVTGVDQGFMFRSMTFPPIWGGTNRAFMSRLEIEMEVGAPVQPVSVLLEWSDDGGVTFNGSRTLTVPAGRRQRVVATRLGSFRQRVLRLSGVGVMTVYAVDAEITPGDA